MERTFRVSAKSLRETPSVPAVEFGIRLWVKQWLRRGAKVIHHVDFETGDYVYVARGGRDE